MNADAKMKACNIRAVVACVLVFSTGLLAACKIKSPLDACGQYQGDGEFAKETIDVKSDGSYTHMVNLKTSTKTVVAAGKWKFRKNYAYFDENFLLVTREFHQMDLDFDKPKKGGAVFTIIRTPWGLEMGSSERVLYKKIRGCDSN